MERFFLNLKMERVWRIHYANHQEPVKDISHYIVAFYNGCRFHSSLGYLSPNQFEAKLTEVAFSRHFSEAESSQNQQIMSLRCPVLVDHYMQTGLLRVIDESVEDYLYSATFFKRVS